MDNPAAELKAIAVLAQQGRLDEARERCRKVQEAQPGLALAWFVASQVELMANRPLEALQLASRCLKLDGGRSPRVLLQMAYALRALFHVEQAMVPAREALASQVADAEVLDALGIFFSQCSRYPEAFAAHQRAVTLSPDSERFRFHLLTVARYVGRFDLAEAECDRIIDAGTANGEVYLVRSQLRTQTIERNHLGQLRDRLGRDDMPGETRTQLQYALGKELEDLGEFEAAFEAFAAGARLRRESLGYQVTADVAQMDRLQNVYDSEWVRQAAPSTLPERPVFVVGMPRSGTTLVERILSSHPDITSSGELNSFGQALDSAALRVAGRRVGNHERVALARAVPPESLGRDYLRHASFVTRPGGRFVDKLPENFLHCALIQAALPGATIVHVMRHPMASCFAMYKTWFNQGYEFSYDFADLARYYAAYRRLVSHWSTVLPRPIVEVSYESLVARFEPEARRIVAACGLEWNDRCLHFHENSAPSATASSVQVRRPLYTEAVDSWRRYGERLDPLYRQLVAAGIPATECS